MTWQVNGVKGGNASLGTISTSGLYTAPAGAPNPNVLTVTVIAQGDTTKTASATVTVNPPAMVINPAGLTLAAGAQQAFTATVNGAAVSPVWSIACRSQASGACGTMSAAGVFVAPTLPPLGGAVAVSARMADGSAVAATTNVAIQFSNASLVGSSRSRSRFNLDCKSLPRRGRLDAVWLL